MKNWTGNRFAPVIAVLALFVSQLPAPGSAAAETEIAKASKPGRERAPKSRPVARAAEKRSKEAVEKFEEGVTFANRGNFSNAITAYDAAIAIDSNFAQAFRKRGVAQQNLGNWQAALDSYSRAIELDPKLAVAINNRGALFDRLGSFDKALADFSAATAADPNDSSPLGNRAQLLMRLRKYDQAELDIHKLVERFPKYDLGFVLAGDLEVARGNFSRAVASYDKAIALNDNNSVAHSNRAIAQLRLGRRDLAFVDADRAIALAPNSAQAYVARATLDLTIGKMVETEADARRALALDGNNVAAAQLLALALTAQKKDSEAAPLAELLAQRAPTADVFAIRCQLRLRSGDFHGALQDEAQALSLNSKYLAARICAGDVYTAMKDFAKARDAYDAAIELAPNLPAGYFLRGQAQFQLAAYPAALEDFGKVVSLAGEDADALRWMGITTCTMEKSCRDALRFFDRSIAAKPTALAYSDRCNARQTLGNLDQARDDCESALKLDPGLYFGHLNLASVLLAKQDFPSASREASLAGIQAPDPRWLRLRAAAELALKNLDAAAKDAQAYTKAASNDPAGWRLLAQAERALGHPQAAADAAAVADQLVAGASK
jgi:tetratricopeptide (TPR) repeat protein